MKSRSFIVSATFAGLAAPVAGQEARIPEWQFGQSETACFAELKGALDGDSFRLERSYRGSSEPVLFVSSRVEAKFPGTGTIPFLIELDGQLEPLAKGLMFLRSDAAWQANARIEGPALQVLTASASSTRLKIIAEGGSVGEREFPGFADNFKHIEDCYGKLGQQLLASRAPGDDGTPGERRATPRSNPGSWITTRDYPTRALMNEESGRATFRVTVNRFGLPNQCVIIASSGSETLDRATCNLVNRRAFFYPARDADGNPVESTVAQSVNWAIPD